MKALTIRHSALLVVAIASAACGTDARTTAKRAADTTQPHKVESFAMDLDGDNRADSLQLDVLTHPSDPGAITKLRIRLASGTVDSVSGSWDPARDDYAAHENEIPSRDAFVHTYPRAGTLVFLFGESVGCCLQSLDIFRITGERLRPYYHSNEFALLYLVDARGDEPALLIGIPSRGEATRTTDTLKAGTYSPTHVILLDTIARLDTALSTKWTRSRLGGFAGLEPRNDVEAVQHVYLWDAVKKRRIP